MEQLKNLAAFILLTICVMVAKIQAHGFRYCENPNDYEVKVKALDFSTYPVTKGEPFTVTISATAGEAIRGGKMIVEIEFHGAPLNQNIRDLCSVTSCPISSATDFVISFSQTLSETTPAGSYPHTASLYNESNRLLTCIKFDFVLTTGSSVA